MPCLMDNQVNTLLAMLDDYQIVQKDKDLPKEVWDYLKTEGFFALIIPEKFGGREFSAIANSTIVSKIATKSLTAAVTVMVPNSLGPGELLLHYGTKEQQDRWLPSLASGKEIPRPALKHSTNMRQPRPAPCSPPIIQSSGIKTSLP